MPKKDKTHINTPTPKELRPGVHLVAESVSSGAVSLWRYNGETVPLAEIERLIDTARVRGATDDSPCIWGYTSDDDWHLSVSCPRIWANGMPEIIERKVPVTSWVGIALGAAAAGTVAALIAVLMVLLS